jgi:hypothetical protein
MEEPPFRAIARQPNGRPPAAALKPEIMPEAARRREREVSLEAIIEDDEAERNGP